jgi:UDPglucose 6-dehydrogenase
MLADVRLNQFEVNTIVSLSVGVVGAGYVGLTLATCLSELGHRVLCVDSESGKVEQLNLGNPTILEPGLPELLRANLETGRLRFQIGSAATVAEAEIIFLCLPTPMSQTGDADTASVMEAIGELATRVRGGTIIVNKSTVPIGFEEVAEAILARDDVHLVSNPEFLREGSSVSDFLNPDRIVVGAKSQTVADRFLRLYERIDAPVIVTDPVSAETIKYGANAMLAARLSLINSLAQLCEVVDADIDDVLNGIGLDHRIGSELMHPGPGWGGSCLPKDTRALLQTSQQAGFDFPLLAQVIDSNIAQIDHMVNRIERAAGAPTSGAKVAALGLTFKAGTDDLRGSPSLEVLDQLIARGASVRAFDPTQTKNPSLDAQRISVGSDPYEICVGADVLVVLTEWPEFSALDFGRIFTLMSNPSIVDARNILDPKELRDIGFTYVGIGRN